MRLEDVIYNTAINIVDDYKDLSELNIWEIYLTGICYGIYMSSDRAVELEDISVMLLEEISVLLN